MQHVRIVKRSYGKQNRNFYVCAKDTLISAATPSHTLKNAPMIKKLKVKAMKRKKQYEVYVKGKKEKVYPYLLQAQIYLVMRGFCYTGKGYYFLDPQTEIREVIDE